MFLSMDLILLFYRWVFAVMLFKKVRCDPFEVAVFHYISVCFWSSVTLAINYLMQSAQCLPAHAGSVCCWWRGRNKGSNNWNWPIKKQCCKNLPVSTWPRACHWWTITQGESRQIQVLNASFVVSLLVKLTSGQGTVECWDVLIHWELAPAPKATSNTWGRVALKLFYATSVWDFCYLCASGFLSSPAHLSSLFSKVKLRNFSFETETNETTSYTQNSGVPTENKCSNFLESKASWNCS